MSDDDVVREMDVYVADSLELYLLQFPLKPVYADLPNVTSGKIRPKHSRLELSVPYDKQLYSSEPKPINKNQKFISSKVSMHSSLGIGVIRDGDIHITPMADLLQMRPSFKDLVTQGEIVEQMDDSDDNDDEGLKEKKSVQQVQMKRKDNDKNQSVRSQTFANIQLEEESEPWHGLKIFPPEAMESAEKFEDMFYQEPPDPALMEENNSDQEDNAYLKSVMI
mmetsp:Transcript_18630/g.18723  ORF Transcript_18630/g.18723 Transcript_18630/m.18723 type:complete len:222 (+) Transcript_18630:92-757(+)|eukprot:CAMPEP_0182427924 /NCGR_PEP_ID=MMETSP1167-20130531/20845_1 /TAXON_ID=2988 /ORGANISM="Mallomonas Sp, Strain CCMP3275" /LENGTH=221 /DNA_ID=CAMNT_0024610509 /DNA_START=88 /DNA_END=753 /DNA_ORIENTATION=-